MSSTAVVDKHAIPYIITILMAYKHFLYNMKYPVRWTGHPHRVPRIRVASTRSLASEQTTPQALAEQSVQQTSKPSFVEASSRRPQRYFRRAHRTFTRSSTRLVRKEASTHARSYPRGAGRSPTAEEQAIHLPYRRHLSKTSLHNLQKHQALQNNVKIRSFDGAGHSAARKRRIACQRKGPNNLIEEVSSPVTPSDHPHSRTRVYTASTISCGSHKRHRGSAVVKSGKVHDTRPLPHSNYRTNGQDPRPFDSATITTQSVASGAVAKSSHRGMRAGKTRRSDENIVRHGISISLQRSPNERAALKKFTQELERHLQKTQHMPPNSFDKILSTHTLQDLLPYRSQFNAAGLAVTSNEQRGRGIAPLQALPCPALTVSINTAIPQIDTSCGIKTMERQETQHSESTMTTVLNFTPPHVVEPQRNRLPTSSDHTIINFTPPHEFRAEHSTPKLNKTTRQSLPWLRPQSKHSTAFSNVDNSSKRVDRNVAAGSRRYDAHLRRQSSSRTTPKLSNVRNLPGLGEKWRIKYASIYDSTIKTSEEHHCRGSPVTSRRETAVLRSAVPTRGASSGQTFSMKGRAHIRTLPESACVPDANNLHGKGESSYHVRADGSGHEGSKVDADYPLTCHHHGERVAKSLLNNEHDACKLVIDDLASETGEAQPTKDVYEQDHKTPAFSSDQSTSTIMFTQPFGCSREDPKSIDRGDFVCQQCYASPYTSVAISPLQVLSAVPLVSQHLQPSALCSHCAQDLESPGFKNGLREISNTKVRENKARDVSKRNKGLRKSGSKSQAIPPRCEKDSSDTSVFKGLHVATAAACDEDVDKWIQDTTGIGVRSFLAALSQFSSLGVIALTDVARRAARQRIAEVETWEAVRRQRKQAIDRNVDAHKRVHLSQSAQNGSEKTIDGKDTTAGC